MTIVFAAHGTGKVIYKDLCNVSLVYPQYYKSIVGRREMPWLTDRDYLLTIIQTVLRTHSILRHHQSSAYLQKS